MQLTVIRFLLWIARTVGFDLPLEMPPGTCVLNYRWVRTPDGRFDHWIESPYEQYNIGDVLRSLGFLPFVGQIVTHSVFIRLKYRRGQREANTMAAAMYSCHGTRALLAEGRPSQQAEGFCIPKWLLKAIKDYDQLDWDARSGQLRAHALNIREAALRSLHELAVRDPKISEMLERAFPPFHTGSRIPDSILPR